MRVAIQNESGRARAGKSERKQATTNKKQGGAFASAIAKPTPSFRHQRARRRLRKSCSPGKAVCCSPGKPPPTTSSVMAHKKSKLRKTDKCSEGLLSTCDCVATLRNLWKISSAKLKLQQSKLPSSGFRRKLSGALSPAATN